VNARREEVTAMARDPVCGMQVDEKQAAAAAAHEGKTYFFCAAGCRAAFVKNPEKYVAPQKAGQKSGA
jgi:Cu+-exporting ATPase